MSDGMEQVRWKIEQLRDRHRPWEGRDQTDAFIKAVLAVEEIRVTWALGALKELGDELDALRAENERLRVALERIRLRFDDEDDGTFGRGGSMSWAMANDARKALE